MKLSLYLPTGTAQEFYGQTDPVAAFARIVELAKIADDAGFETLWLPDHFIPFGPPGCVFEAWTSLAALTRETQRIRLGQLVTGNGYRNPALQAKMASNLDVLAGGRFTFGIGAGWYEQEYVPFGYEFPSAGERLRRLEEALQITLGMWSGEATTFAGRVDRVADRLRRPASGRAIRVLGTRQRPFGPYRRIPVDPTLNAKGPVIGAELSGREACWLRRRTMPLVDYRCLCAPISRPPRVRRGRDR